jgi:hypothetical protein
MSSDTPETDDFQEIDRLLNQALPAKIQAGVGKALKGLVLGVVNTRLAISSGLLPQVGNVKRELEVLNKNIRDASTSSERLTTAIKNATIAAAIITGVGVLVAVAALAFEMYKYFHSVK